MTTKEISRFDLEWMMVRVEETAAELKETIKDLEDRYYFRDDDTFCPYRHIGTLTAQLEIFQISLSSILEVTKGV